MEIGRIAQIENSKVNNSEKTEKVVNVDEKNKVIQEDKYKKALGSENIADKNEIILDNVKFGYNKSSKDFFVKITRGEAEYKYPTEDIMKVKAYILQELESQNK
ncbi:flagellin [Arcobacter caeni]|uniref:Flagellin n=1 Tax=Arcobacter caeni TaxID=1912877 RepID=A0A363CY96_9BACT|nr:flagellin [Arcobacter caeni]PUE64014.1 flagellin [Arcobacter caeni]